MQEMGKNIDKRPPYLPAPRCKVLNKSKSTTGSAFSFSLLLHTITQADKKMYSHFQEGLRVMEIHQIYTRLSGVKLQEEKEEKGDSERDWKIF